MMIRNFAFRNTNDAADEANNIAAERVKYTQARSGSYPYTQPERFRVGFSREECPMRVIQGVGLAAIVLSLSAASADELRSGPEKRIGGPFDVKAVTGASKGKTF